MKSRTIEIIDNHIKALEEELEWYQEKNQEWQEKCERLREQLRWHDAKKEPPNKSGHYIVMTTLGMLARMYYTSTYGWSTPGIVSKWCYIPDDNQGTDCTPEGE